MKFIKIFLIAFTFSLNFSISSYANQSVEEIIKGRKAILVGIIKQQKKFLFYLSQKKSRKQNP
jgi:hypothetical protein